MNKIQKDSEFETRLLSIEEVSKYLGIGKGTARTYMDQIGATRKFGRRVVFDKEIIDSNI